MKKTVSILILFLVISNLAYSQNTIPNPGFENWTNATTPADWNAKVSVTLIVPINLEFANRSSDSHSGNYAIELIPQSILTMNVPGVCQLGSFDITFEGTTPTVDFVGGIPFSEIPTQLNAWVKYMPQGTDTMQILVYASKWNIVTGSRDIVAGGRYTSNETMNDYTLIELPVTRYIPEMMPDTLNIVFATAGNQNCNLNTRLFVDDVSIETDANTIQESEQVKFSVSPNPATENISVQMQNTTDPFSIYVFDMNGKMILEQTGLRNHSVIDVKTLSKGVYFIKIEQNGIDSSHKFVVK